MHRLDFFPVLDIEPDITTPVLYRGHLWPQPLLEENTGSITITLEKDTYIDKIYIKEQFNIYIEQLIKEDDGYRHEIKKYVYEFDSSGRNNRQQNNTLQSRKSQDLMMAAQVSEDISKLSKKIETHPCKMTKAIVSTTKLRDLIDEIRFGGGFSLGPIPRRRHANISKQMFAHELKKLGLDIAALKSNSRHIGFYSNTEIESTSSDGSQLEATCKSKSQGCTIL